MHGADFSRDLPAYFGADLQSLDLLTNGFGQARSGLAGRCSQADAQWPALLHCRCLQQRQQAHHGGRLASTGAASDDAETGTGGQGTGELLPVQLASWRAALEQLRQALWQIRRRCFGLTQALAQGMVDAPFVTPVTAQVKALATAYQWPRLLARRITCGHQRAGADALKPGIQVKVGQQLRWQ